VKNTQERVKQEYEDNIRAERSAQRNKQNRIQSKKYKCLKTYMLLQHFTAVWPLPLTVPKFKYFFIKQIQLPGYLYLYITCVAGFTPRN
jgi:hypothetical protein